LHSSVFYLLSIGSVDEIRKRMVDRRPAPDQQLPGDLPGQSGSRHHAALP